MSRTFPGIFRKMFGNFPGVYFFLMSVIYLGFPKVFPNYFRTFPGNWSVNSWKYAGNFPNGYFPGISMTFLGFFLDNFRNLAKLSLFSLVLLKSLFSPFYKLNIAHGAFLYLSVCLSVWKSWHKQGLQVSIGIPMIRMDNYGFAFELSNVLVFVFFFFIVLVVSQGLVWCISVTVAV